MNRFVILGFLIACHSSSAPTTPAPTGGATTITAQVDQGKQLYGAKCASCHGNAGEGTKDGPPVVGKDAFPLDAPAGRKRDAKFHTAADIFGWTTQHMPANDPGSVTTEQFLAIFAFDLTANGIKLDKPLDGDAAAKIVLHP